MRPHEVFLSIALAWLIGVALGSLKVELGLLIISCAVFLFLSPLAFSPTKGSFFKVFLCALVGSIVLLTGFVYTVFSIRHYESKLYAPYSQVQGLGTVVSYPQVRQGVASFNWRADQDTHKLLQVYTVTTRKISYGERLEIKGEASLPSGDDFRGYYLTSGIHGILNYPEIIRTDAYAGNKIIRLLYGFKDQIVKPMNALLKADDAAFLKGLVLGDRSGFSKEFKDQSIASGTTHLTALSGFNITLLIVMTNAFTLWFMSRRKAFMVSVLLIFLFLAMTGASSSLMRAAIMGVVFLLARFLGERVYMPSLLTGTAVLMTIIKPEVLIFDIGFQLSFAAYLGIALVSPILHKRLFSSQTGRALITELIITTITAEMAVLPLVLYYFRDFSVVGIFTNLLVMPFVPIIMFSALIMCLAYPLLPFIARVVAWLLTFLLDFVEGCIYFFSILNNKLQYPFMMKVVLFCVFVAVLILINKFFIRRVVR